MFGPRKDTAATARGFSMRDGRHTKKKGDGLPNGIDVSSETTVLGEARGPATSLRLTPQQTIAAVAAHGRAVFKR